LVFITEYHKPVPLQEFFTEDSLKWNSSWRIFRTDPKSSNIL